MEWYRILATQNISGIKKNQVLKESQILNIRVRIPRLLSRLLSVVEINVDIVAATSVIPFPVGAALLIRRLALGRVQSYTARKEMLH